MSAVFAIIGSILVGVYMGWQVSKEEAATDSPVSWGMATGLITFVIIMIATDAVANWLKSI
jgi:hypothetical protein